MNLFRYLLPVLAACGLSAGYAQQVDSVDEHDMEAMKQFISSKRKMFLEDKHSNLSISGDVRVEWKRIKETHAGAKLVGSCHNGPGTSTSRGNNQYDIEFNVYFDYVAERTWASVWLEFDNDMGFKECTALSDVASGECSNVCLKAAFMGYNVFEQGTSRFDIEVGRRPFYAVFDSVLQFNQQFDGFLLKYSNTFEGIGDFYVNGGGFVVDSVPDNYGWIVELGLLDIADINLDVKYSYYDMKNNKSRDCTLGATHTTAVRWMEFRNSQISAAYHFNPEMLRTDVKIYGAFIHNHAATRRSETDNKKEDNAWYVGVMFGGVEVEGDWSIDINYQHVEAQSVQDCDMGGIGRGNAGRVAFVSDNTQGNVNFHGFMIEALYALTDNITLGAEYEHANEDEDAIGGSHKFRKFELSANYGW